MLTAKHVARVAQMNAQAEGQREQFFVKRRRSEPVDLAQAQMVRGRDHQGNTQLFYLPPGRKRLPNGWRRVRTR